MLNDDWTNLGPVPGDWTIIDDAWNDGYDSYLNDPFEPNPFNHDVEPDIYDAWQRGFVSATAEGDAGSDFFWHGDA